MTGIRREPRSLPICRRFSRAIRKFAGPGWILPDAVAFSVRAGFPPTPLSHRAAREARFETALYGRRCLRRQGSLSARVGSVPAPLSSRVDAGTALAPGTRDVSAATKGTSSASEAAMHVHGRPADAPGPPGRRERRRRRARAAGQGPLPVHRSLAGRGVSGRLLAPET